MTTVKNYYELLEIKSDASKLEIKKAFYAQSKKWHPDVCKKENATEMFQLINEAYQTLYNDDSRKEYDEYLKSNTNSFTNLFSKSDYFDVTILNKYMSSPWNENELNELFNSLSDNQVALLYEYFWITFWSGSSLSELLLKNRKLQKMFNYFMDNKYLRNNYFDEVSKNHEIRQSILNNGQLFLDSIKYVINQFENNSFNKKTKGNFYNFMADLINHDNLFDHEISAVLATKNMSDISKMFDWFETIYHECNDMENISSRTNAHDKFSHKKLNMKTMSISLGSLIFIILLIIFIIFKWF